MNKKKNCCDFFKKILKKEPKDQPESSQNHVGSTVKTSFEENSEVQGKSKSSNEEKKSQKIIISENYIPRNESDSNSFFYDKNSAVYCFADTGLAINLAGLVIGQMLLGSNLLLFYGRKSLMTKKIMIMIIFTKNAVIPGITFVLTLFF